MSMPAKEMKAPSGFKALTLALLGSAIVACGVRPVNVDPSASDGGIAEGPAEGLIDPDAGPASTKYASCKYPQGTCDFNGQCDPDAFCDGALHTLGQPHEFVCRGVCKPKLYPACDPTLANPLEATIEYVPNDGRLHLLITNLGCKPVYRIEGCCGEGDPWIKTRSGNGQWGDLDYSFPGPCCNALPVCTVLQPMATRDIPLLPFLTDCDSSVRAGVSFTPDSECNQDGVAPWLTVEATAEEMDCD